ncbi:hypothetical protein CHLNCDRAFT_139330 [Chlorella variabilis]|uniref:ENTH domain-containing protein n=1 Tax=Chlorella variabilis TaxID=554065 RepID=E1ZQ13_CHLVA|nr:hypothetical protein CHLNCDRAFT_139330 [Chlorella variabilis]EFN52159.1 hypothetical protein CHLNCDRAFT_139330 [Chlorella variabilis]|eukprot:XP_005844261.1 hypothetical protein CHLNCDRAFT_139330 [Chlorella variabilis]
MSELVGAWVGWAKTKLLVEQATSSTDDPTPIYMLDEVVAALADGDTRAGVDAVALKLVTHIGRKGSSDLRRLMARRSGAVRDLLHYRCDPDPFKGDTVWKRVQEYAQEALNAIHGTPDSGGRIQGFGSDAPGSGGGGYGSSMGFGSDSAGGGSSSSSRMVGFGSADVLQSGMQTDGYSASAVDGADTFAGAAGSAAPGRDDLQAFVDGISGLDGPSVAQLLERKLEVGPWQSTLRALCAIEAVAESGSSAACGQVAVHFQAHPEAHRTS